MTDSGKEQNRKPFPGLPHVRPVSYQENTTQIELQRIIDDIDPKTPKVFIEQAQESAGFIQLLDQGGGLTDPKVRKFLDQLITTTFVLIPQVKSPYQLPKWLQMDFLILNGIREPFRSQRDLPDSDEYSKQFDRWIRETNATEDANGFVFDPTPRGPRPRGTKAYIEHEALMSAYTQGKLPVLISNFTEEGYPLYAVKSNVESLVLYFKGDIAEFEKADKAFKRTGIKYRGPAQDVYTVRLKSDGEMIVRSTESNDQAFTRHNGYLRDRTYSPQSFLRDYLALCHKMGKNPALPYQTSFVYFISDLNLEGKEREYMDQASQMTGYPVLYRGVSAPPAVKPPPVFDF